MLKKEWKRTKELMLEAAKTNELEIRFLDNDKTTFFSSIARPLTEFREFILRFRCTK